MAEAASTLVPLDKLNAKRDTRGKMPFIPPRNVLPALSAALELARKRTKTREPHLYDERPGCPDVILPDDDNSRRCKEDADRGRGSRPMLIVLVI